MQRLLETPKAVWQERPADCEDVVWRYDQNPIIDRNPIPCASRVFNSAVLPYEDRYVGIFRIDRRDGRPQLHLGFSDDGRKWTIDHDKIQWIDEDGSPVENGYAYDPRLCRIDDTYYVTWCDDFPGATVGLGRTSDFKTFVKMESPLMPFNRNGVLFPRTVDGEYLLLSRPSDSGHTPFGEVILSRSKDLVYWGKHRLVMKPCKKGWWQNVKIGSGSVPIETSEGWLVFYHGVTSTCNGLVYSLGAVLLDLQKPEKVIARSRDYLLTPEAPYETTGFVPNVIFPCAALHDPGTGRIAIYYGAADTYTALAFTTTGRLISHLKSSGSV